MFDFGNISPHLFSPTVDFSKKKYTQTTSNVTNQVTNTYSPTYMYQIESANASMKKADSTTVTPSISTTQTPSFSASAAGKDTEKGGLLGGIDLTGIGVVAVLAVAAIVVMKK